MCTRPISDKWQEWQKWAAMGGKKCHKEDRSFLCDPFWSYKSNRGCAILWQGINVLEAKIVCKGVSDAGAKKENATGIVFCKYK